MKKVCTFIRKKRIERGLTTIQMADEIGMSQSTYSKMERGLSKLEVRRLVLIAEALKIPLMDFPLGSSNNEPSAENSCNCEQSLHELKEIILQLRKDLLISYTPGKKEES